MKHYIVILVIMSVVTLHAQTFGGSDWLSGQNQLLVQILAQEKLGNTALMTDVVPRAVQAVEVANSTLATIRNMKRLYETVSNYTVKKVLRDVKNGMQNAFPGLQQLEQNISEMRTNANGIAGMVQHGENRFWLHKSRWDRKTGALLDRMVESSEKSYVFPAIAPRVSATEGWGKPTTAAKMMKESMIKSGMYKDLFLREVQKKFVHKEMEELDEWLERRRQNGMPVDQKIMRLALQNKQLMLIGQDIEKASQILQQKKLQEMSEAEKVRFMNKLFSDSYWNEVEKKASEKYGEGKDGKDEQPWMWQW